MYFYFLIIFLSLIGFCLVKLFGRYFGPWVSAMIGASFVFGVFIFSLFILCEISVKPCFTDIVELNRVYIGTSEPASRINVILVAFVDSVVFRWGFLFDRVRCSMCVVVTLGSFLVSLYLTRYVSHNTNLPGFMSYLSLFVFFMLNLITADNVIQGLVCCGAVGVTLYLLISFWLTRMREDRRTTNSILLHKIMDVFLMIFLGIILIFAFHFVAEFHNFHDVITTVIKDYYTDVLNLKPNKFNILLVIVKHT